VDCRHRRSYRKSWLARLQAHKLLVVEDDPDVRQSVMATLGSLGYRVLAAAHGSEAIGILHGTQRVDLLFTDIVMPLGVSGVEVAKEARRLRAGIKVLLTSGYAQDVIVAQGANGNFPVFAKPYRQQDLAREVRRLMTSSAG
jgi:CheY-like chemotaxis protein